MLANFESRGLSLARGFIVLIMPAVHTVLLYSSPIIKAGIIGQMLGFLEEQPGAQLFMFQMGLFVGVGKNKSFTTIFKRKIILFLSGYLLNFIRLVLPFYWGWLPEEFLNGNQVPDDCFKSVRLLMTGDILQFAALGYLTCWVLKKLLKKAVRVFFIFGIPLSISPIIWQISPQNSFQSTLLYLFNGSPPDTFFPYFPWIIYPISGLIAGLLWQERATRKSLIWLSVSVFLLFFGYLMSTIEIDEWKNNFYRLGPGLTLFHIGAAMLWIALFVFIAKVVKKAYLLKLLLWLSENITSIYFVQWILIIWLLPLIGYEKLSFSETLIAIMATSLLSFSLPNLTQFTFSKFKTPQNEPDNI